MKKTVTDEAPLAYRAVRGGVWVAVSSWWTIAFGFAANIVLTRLLSPEAFGTFALAMFFAQFLRLEPKTGAIGAAEEGGRVGRVKMAVPEAPCPPPPTKYKEGATIMPQVGSSQVGEKFAALKRFTERLITGPCGSLVAKIILFGSLAKGEARPESDIDVLVFSFDGLEALRDACAEAAFEVAVEMGEGIEPLVYPLAEYFNPRTYFTYRAARFGKEVFSVDEVVLRRREADAQGGLAMEYLAGARRAFAAGDLRIAIDAAYNAAELGVKGLLLLKVDDLPGSHGGLVGKFGELYVKTGLLPGALGRRLNRGLEARANARYNYAAQITEEMAQEVMDLAQEILAYLEQAMQAGGSMVQI